MGLKQTKRVVTTKINKMNAAIIQVSLMILNEHVFLFKKLYTLKLKMTLIAENNQA